MLSGSGKESPLWCLECKGFGYFFEGKFLPEQRAWSESLLTKPTGRNWSEENQACWSLFTLDLGNWGVGFDQLPYIQAYPILLRFPDISFFKKLWQVCGNPALSDNG